VLPLRQSLKIALDIGGEKRHHPVRQPEKTENSIKTEKTLER
jgi:hypothetical protein